MAINLSRNTRLWVSTVDKDGAHTNATTFEIPIQDGYSLSQSVTVTDVSIDEAGPTPSRGGDRFNDTLDPVDWSFMTYVTPYVEATKHYLVDMILWHALASGTSIATDFDNSGSSSVFGDTTDFSVGFDKNSEHELTQLFLYFKVDNQMYYVANAQIGQAEISLDISDITQTTWTGQALTYVPIADPSFVSVPGLSFNEAAPGTAPQSVAINASKKYLVNKLTVLDFTSDVAPDSNDNYSIPITSATITINNNITYLTPSTLAEVDVPIGSFTGHFEVTGTIEAYARKVAGADGTDVDGLRYGTEDLLAHMLANVASSVSNITNLIFKVGGSTGPRMEITIPTAHLNVPELSIDDVVTTTMEFKGIPTSTDLVSGDEISINFFGA